MAKTKSKQSDPLAEIARRRAQEQALLEKELARLDAQISSLSLRRQLVLSLLGLSSTSTATSPSNPTEPSQDGERLKKCADCGTLVPGPNDRGDCPACHAGPFEEAR